MYKFTLAVRYLIRRRISYFAVAAVALCVFVVLVVITVLTGLSAEFKGKVHSSVGDCVVHTRSLVGFGYYEQFLDILEKQPYIKAATPLIKNYGLIKVSQTSGLGIYGEYTREIVGIEPVSFSQVTGFGQWLAYNRDNVGQVFRPAYDANLPGCVPGIDFLFDRDQSGNYQITTGLVPAAFEISCIPLTAKGALAKAGAGEFNSKTFYYSDHFHAGYSLDWRLIFLPFNDVQMLCGMATGHKRITAIDIKFSPGVRLSDGCRKVKTLWGDFLEQKTDAPYSNLLEKVQVQSWKEASRAIVALVETQQTMMIVCFGMIGIITVFIVLVVFYMIVSHKSKDIGILLSLGAGPVNILSVFLNFAFLIGIVGSAFGALVGWRFLVHINQIEDWLFENFEFQIWDRSISSIVDIPNAIDLKVLAVIIVSAIGACLVGALLPSCRAARLKPVDTLQVSQL